MFKRTKVFVGVVDFSFWEHPGGTTADASFREERNEVLRRFQQAAGMSCKFLPTCVREHRTFIL